jgi:serine/threonine protein phosphatase PrpC
MMSFQCTARTHVGGRRKLNEDALLCAPERRIWAVADGMGGHDAGEVASDMVIAALAGLPADGTLSSRAQRAINALERVNAALIDLAQAAGEGRTIGSTVVGLIAEEFEYGCFWAGDSRALRLRQGQVSQITRDHSLVQDLVEAGMLEAERAEDHPNANMLTRAVGAAPALTVDCVTGPVMAGDIFILASDGLTRVVKTVEMASILSSFALEDAGDRLLDLTLARGAPDNVSFILIRFDTAATQP